jgi:hypothetical protein
VRALKIATVMPAGTDPITHDSSVVMVEFVDQSFAARSFDLRGKPTPEAGWYLVRYANNYESFSPAQAFEEGYTLLIPYPPNQTPSE